MFIMISMNVNASSMTIYDRGSDSDGNSVKNKSERDETCDSIEELFFR